MRNESKYINLIQRRKQIGLTQQQLADKVGVSTSAVKAWEHHDGNITRDNLFAYADLLHIDPMEIIDPEHHFKHINDIRGINFDDTGSLKDISTICANLSPARFQRVYKLARQQLKQQYASNITYENIKAEQRDMNLLIDGEITGTDEVKFYKPEDKYSVSFNGHVPDSYSKCLTIQTDALGSTFTKGQKVFLNTVTAASLYSGILVIARKNGKYYLRVHRSTNHNLYMIPIQDEESVRTDADLLRKEEKYIWRESDGWEIVYTLNQFHY